MTTKVKTTTTSVEISKGSVDLDRSVESVLKRFNDTKAAIKALEAEKAEMDKMIRDMLGDAEVGVIDGIERVRIETRGRTDMNKELLKTVYPEAYEASLVKSTYTIIQTL